MTRIRKEKICLVLFLCAVLLSSANAQLANWYDLAGTRIWEDAYNWDTYEVPTAGDNVWIHYSPGPVVTETGNTCLSLTAGIAETAGQANIDVNSGSLDVLGYILLSAAQNYTFDVTANIRGGLLECQGLIASYYGPCKSQIYITGGELNVAEDFHLGLSGQSVMEINGGNVTVGRNMALAYNPTGKARLNLYGGIFDVNGLIFGSGSALMNIGNGILYVSGDVEDDLKDLINEGKITFYNGNPRAYYDIEYLSEPNKTTLSAYLSSSQQAYSPSPANHGEGIAVDANLSWVLGNGAVSHNVYLGTDPCSLVQVASGLAAVGKVAYGDVYYTRSVAGGLISHLNSALNDNYLDNGGGNGVFTGLSVDTLTGAVYSSSDRGGGTIDKFSSGLTAAGSVGVPALDVTVNPNTGDMYSCRPNLIDRFTTLLGYVNSNYIGRNVTNIAVDTASNAVFSIAPAASVSELSYIDKFSSALDYLTSGVGYGIFRDIVVNPTTGYVYVLRDTDSGNVILDRFNNNLGYLNSNVLGTGTAWKLAINSESGEVYAAMGDGADGGLVKKFDEDLVLLGSSEDLGTITALAVNFNGEVLVGRTLNDGTLSRLSADLVFLSEVGNQGDINFIAFAIGERETFDPGKMRYRTKYYWRIDEFDGSNIVQGKIWDFTTLVPVCDPELNGDANGDCKVDFTDFAISAEAWMTCTAIPAEACSN